MPLSTSPLLWATVRVSNLLQALIATYQGSVCYCCELCLSAASKCCALHAVCRAKALSLAALFLRSFNLYELPTHLRARFREVGASLLVSTHYWVLTGMSTMPPSGRSKKLVPEFLEGIIHDQNVRQQPLSSPRLRMGNFAATVKKRSHA